MYSKFLFRYIVFLLMSFGILDVAFSQPGIEELKKAHRILESRDEVRFSFLLPDSVGIQKFGRLLSVDRVRDNRVWAYANSKQFELFKLTNISFDVDTVFHSVGHLKASGLHYISYSEYLSIMNRFVTNYPNLISVTEFGKSVNGKSLLCAKIGNQIGTVDKPEVLYVGGIHGDEPVGYVLLVNLIDYLLTNYNQPAIKDLVDHLCIYICPLVNPDGVYFGDGNTITKPRRFNANSVDLNRNFPDIAGNAHPDGNNWQPETFAMMEFLKQHHVVLSANFHGGAELVNYPWDFWAKLHADDNWFKQISRAYADTVHTHSFSGFFIDENNGITNGYQWYYLGGGRQDYATFYQGCREITIEMSTDKLPDESLLDAMWNYHYRSLLQYLQQANKGIQGQVTDHETHLPLKAQVKVLNHDDDNSVIYTDSITGKFYRLIQPGNYTLRITANGYFPRSFQYSANAKNTMQNYWLSSILPDSISIDSIEVTIAPNPFTTYIVVSLNGSCLVPVHINLFSIAGGKAYSVSLPNLLSEIEIDLSFLKGGMYVCCIEMGNRRVITKLVKLNGN